MNKNNTTALIITILIIFSLAHCSTNSSQKSLVNAFNQSRESGTVASMRTIFEKMVSLGIIKKGMTSDQVIKVLGKAQNWTGIYTPGGISIGYGNQKPTSKNHPDFFWLNFRAEDWQGKNEKPKVLISWN